MLIVNQKVVINIFVVMFTGCLISEVTKVMTTRYHIERLSGDIEGSSQNQEQPRRMDFFTFLRLVVPSLSSTERFMICRGWPLPSM
jgi:hypothetical protein